MALTTASATATKQQPRTMQLIELTSLQQEGAEMFSALTEAQLRNRLEPDRGIFIVESPKVINVALRAGYSPVALLCERRHITGDASDIISRCGDIPVYTGERELLAGLTGYQLTRGVLCAMRRPQPRTLEDVCHHHHWCHLPLGCRTGHRCSPSDTQLLRSAQSASGARVDGVGVLSSLDMARWANKQPQRSRLQNGRYGAFGQLHPARYSRTESHPAPGHYHGHRR